MESDRRAVADRACDEDRDAEGAYRPGYAAASAALARVDLRELGRSVTEHLRRNGVGFGSDPFVVDPMPRLISGSAWDRLAAGLAQRARALNHFLRDAYAERRIVTEGVIPADVIDEAEGFEPDLVGRLPDSGAAPASVIGFDLVRDPEGEFMVLEDNLRTPSGYSYAVAARRALLEVLPAGLPTPRPIEPALWKLLGGVLRAAAHPERRDDPELMIVVLTDGPGNVAYYEHALAARQLGVALLTPADLARDRTGVNARLPDGTRRHVDVIYRRTDEDRVRDQHGRRTAVAALIVPAWLDGRVGLVNAFGNGLADDKCAHGYVEDFIRFYLGEEPLVRSVPTRTLRSPAEVRAAIGQLKDLVVKPRHGHGGKGVVIGAEAEPAELKRVAADLERSPERFIVQPVVPISRHPTLIDGHFEPRHVDLRPFAFCAQDAELLPGGLTRVAFAAGALVVNSSQNGGGKDTWVFD